MTPPSPELAASPVSSPGEWIEMPVRSAVRSAVPHDVREYVAEMDEALVYRSYLRSYLRTGVRIKMIQGATGQKLGQEVYYAGQREVLDSILGHGQVLMACTPSDHWQTLGFVVFDDLPSGLLLHYVYVKKIFRKAGLASELVLQLLGDRRDLVHTHFTAPWRLLERSLKRRGACSSYNPYLAK